MFDILLVLALSLFYRRRGLIHAHVELDHELDGRCRVVVAHDLCVVILEAVELLVEALHIGCELRAWFVKQISLLVGVAFKVDVRLFARLGLKLLKVSWLDVAIFILLAPDLEIGLNFANRFIEGLLVRVDVIRCDGESNTPAFGRTVDIVGAEVVLLCRFLDRIVQVV